MESGSATEPIEHREAENPVLTLGSRQWTELLAVRCFVVKKKDDMPTQRSLPLGLGRSLIRRLIQSKGRWCCAGVVVAGRRLAAFVIGLRLSFLVRALVTDYILASRVFFHPP